MPWYDREKIITYFVCELWKSLCEIQILFKKNISYFSLMHSSLFMAWYDREKILHILYENFVKVSVRVRCYCKKVNVIFFFHWYIHPVMIWPSKKNPRYFVFELCKSLCEIQILFYILFNFSDKCCEFNENGIVTSEKRRRST